MTFTKVNNEWYPEFYISDNNMFSIGVTHELFGRLKIQVMHRESLNKETNWYVIQEYVSYQKDLIDVWVHFKIMKALEPITATGREWQLVEAVLPERIKKYLED